MDEKGLKHRILKFISSKPKKSEATAKIAQALRVPRKSLNANLYKLGKEGHLIRVQSIPPVWGIAGEVSVSQPSSPARITGGRGGTSDDGQDNVNKQTTKAVHRYLKGRKTPAKSIDIAKATGFSRVAEINPVLYQLLEKNVIEKKPGKTPTWKLVVQQETPDSELEDEDWTQQVSAFKYEQGPQTSGTVPIFQDTQLFKTDLNFETDATELFKSENICDPETSEGGTEKNYDGGGDYMGGSCGGGGDLEGEEDFEESKGECGGYGFDEEQENRSPSSLYGNRVFEDNSNVKQEVDSDINEDSDSDQDRSMKMKSETESNAELKPNLASSDPAAVSSMKPKTFRQMFGLDDPNLDEDSSQSLPDEMHVNTNDRLDENVNEFNQISCEKLNSEMGLLKNEAILTTPALPVLEIEQVTPEPANPSNEIVMDTPNIVNSVLEMENDVSCLNDESTVNIKQKIVSSNNSGQALGDMDDCDKVLKVLASFPGTTQFVLKKKTEFSTEKLEGVMKKCENHNFVTGSSRLWKITEEGDRYIKIKLNSNMPSNSDGNPLEVAPRQKPRFQGPPPPPMAILKSKGVAVEAADTPQRQAFGTGTVSSIHSGKLPRTNRNVLLASLNHLGGFSSAQIHANGKPSDNVFKSSPDISQTGPKPLMSTIVFPSKSLQISNKPQSQPVVSNVASSSKIPLFPSQLAQKQRSETSHPSGESDTSTCQLYQGNRNSVMNQSDFQSNHTYGVAQSSFGNNQIAHAKQSHLNSGFQDESSYGYQSTMNSGFQDKSSSDNQSTMKSGLWETGRYSGMQESYINVNKNSIKSTSAPPPSSLFNSTTTRLGSNSKKSKSQLDLPPPRREIPKEYADYPNQSTPLQSLKAKTQKQLHANNTRDLSKSVFKKGPPPSPLDILSKNLKKTDISSPPISEPAKSVYQPNISFSSQTHSSTFSRPEPPEQMLVNQSRQVGSQNMFSSGNQSFSTSNNQQQKPFKTVAANHQLALSTESFAALNKNPVSALMEYAQSRKLVAHVEVLSRRGSAHKPTFELAAFVGDRKFPTISCSNKKEGRQEACDIAMRQLVAEGQLQAESGKGASMMSNPSQSLSMTHFDKIAALTHRGFTALVSQITVESFAGRKVIAGLVMKRSEADTGVLVSLGTGNRCITGPQLSLQGNTVNDSHAEIITRRGFIRFLYKQLMEYDPSKVNPLFEKSPSGKLQIRPNITFHLYISTAPCGDGALFSPRDAEANKGPVDTRVKPPHSPTFSNNVQGLLRTKVEGGEGTIPVEPGFKCQTFDGIQRGERLRTMSCTDKICRWNVVGMQGALLSNFLEPVYLDSLTLGLLYDHGHLSRAVCCRVEKGPTDINTQLPPGYKLNHPWLGRVTVCDPPREVQKTKALSINWSFGDNGPEVTDGTLGVCYTSIEKGFFSRCSKRSLFMKFKALCEKAGRQDLLEVGCYKDAKMMAHDFQAAREAMLAKFKENGYGQWVSKPVEEEMFQFEEHNS